nr:probable peptidase [uncultured Mediterranean phage uvMED]
MKIQVIRTQLGKDATNGLVFIDGQFECYSLEDQYQKVKVMHETCIPEGEYEVKLRTVGGFNDRYTKKYPTFHKGMLELQNVPGFQYILIHQGNTDEHTSGCLIVGNTQQDLDVNFNGMVGSSADAYQKLYKKVSAAILIDEKVTIKYSKINLDGSTGECCECNKIDNIEDTVNRIENKLKLSKLIK